MRELEQQPAGMPDDLLRTKIVPPRPHARFVPRAGLLARVDAGLERKLTLIAAPAGFGKTTLLAEWLHREGLGAEGLGIEGSAQAPSPQPQAPAVAWLSLDAGDDDPVRFWRYVLSACQAWHPAAAKPPLAALRMAQQPELESVLTQFINEVAQLPGRYVLVLEDYHNITAPEVHKSVAFLIEHLPSAMHLIVTARSEPALPLARLRARDELTELTAGDLRFSRAEIQAFLEQTLGMALSPQALAQLDQRTEGWVAGLRLLALALQHAGGAAAAEQFLETFTGGHRHVVAYLISEVLALQPEHLRAFLLDTCFLARLSGPLCDAVTGRSGGDLALEQLEHANLFLLPLGSAHGQRWYRYYALFAEALQQYARQQLGEAHVRSLRERASAWYEAQGLLHEAIEEALAAGHAARAATLIERLFERGGFNELLTLRHWAERLPEPALRQRPLLCLAYANALLFTLDRYAPATAMQIERWIQAAESSWRAEQNAPRLGQVATLRSMVAFWQGDLPRAFACARQALELLDEHDITYRSVSLLHAGQEQLLAGRLRAAQRSIMEARTLYEVDQNIHGKLAAAQLLAELCYQQGELEQAAYYYQQQLEGAVGGEEMLDDQGYALCGLGGIAYERDELDAAEQQAQRAFELASRRHAEALQAQAAVVLSQVRHARGRPGQAWHDLQSLATQIYNPLLLREVQSWQARLALATGDLEFARRWQAGIAAAGEPGSRLLHEREALIAARLRLAQGDAPAALAALEDWRAEASAQGRIRGEIEILIVQALAHGARADQAGAAQALARALRLGQPGGFRRIFLDEGAPLAALLQTVAPELPQRALAAYAAALLRALAPGPATAAEAAALPLLEPLSPTEQRVLRLIVAGRSNTEIARELIVSTNTVKTHVKNIYRKLGVGTRDEARAAARELNLR